MSDADMQAATETAFILLRAKLDSKGKAVLSDEDRLVFAAGFAEGAQWLLNTIREECK